MDENTLNPEFCEECYQADAMVIDSRITENGRRRRYQCKNGNCKHRWSTYESHRPNVDPLLKTLEVLAEKLDLMAEHSAQAKIVLARVRQTMSRR